jgi:hypothetical protein
MGTIRDDRQCAAHQQVIEAISDMRGIVDDRLEHITGRVDRIYEMLATGRNGGGNGSANTLTVTASAAPPPPAVVTSALGGAGAALPPPVPLSRPIPAGALQGATR